MNRKYKNYSDEEYYDDWEDYGDSGGFRKIVLAESSSEYTEVLEKFQKSSSTKEFFLTVTQIDKVINHELLLKFERKKKEYRQRYGKVRVVKVFHGTKEINIPSILLKNLLVEFHGRNIGHRFGAGVSFSAWAHKSSHYCDRPIGQMLLCFVIVSNITEVPEVKRGPCLKEPPYIKGLYPLRYDTTAKNKKLMDVIVKFENHTFYPAYVIHFINTSSLSNLPCDDFNSGRAAIARRQPVPTPSCPLTPHPRNTLAPVWAAPQAPTAAPKRARTQTDWNRSYQPSLDPPCRPVKKRKFRLRHSRDDVIFWYPDPPPPSPGFGAFVFKCVCYSTVAWIVYKMMWGRTVKS